ncbi:MAG: cellulase family glycosylhydrolase [Lentisphaerae bacterium]|nr:cellulase family glycosylhydrolase [Lentisphaerota bacterium]
MKRFIFVILFLFAILTLDRDVFAQATVFPQKFHLENNSALDESKKPFVFKGVSTRDPLGMNTGNTSFQNECVPLDEKLFSTIQGWGANTVRLPVLPFFWKIQGKTNTLKALDQAVEWAGKHHMYVVIAYQATGWPSTDNPSDKSGRTTLEDLHSFWREVSDHFKGNKVVAMYELFSEPVTKEFMNISEKDWIDWANNMEILIDVVRKNDPEAICLVSGLSWARDISFIGSNPVNRENVGYSVHPYPYESQLVTMKNLRAVSSLAGKQFVFATELGYDIELFVNLSDVRKKILELYPEVKPQMDEVKRQSGNKLYFSDLNRMLLETLMSNPKTSSYLNEVTENYQKELKKTLGDGNISWCAWCMSCAWRPCLIKDKQFNPTDAGDFFRKWLLEKK